VAGEIEAIPDATDFYVVHVDDFRKAGGDGLEFLFQCGVGDFFLTRLDGRGLAFDVGEDGDDFGNFSANLRFELGYAVMSFLSSKVLVEFEVLLDVQFAFEILHADVVHVDVVARGDGADAVEDAFVDLRPG